MTSASAPYLPMLDGAIHPRCAGCERLYPTGLHESCADLTVAEEGMGWGPGEPFPGDGWSWWDHHVCDALCNHEGICEPPPRPHVQGPRVSTTEESA